MQPELRAAIVQDAETGRVLMLAWMDDEALAPDARDRRGVVLEPLARAALAQGRDVREHARRRGAARRLRRRRAARCACARPGPRATPGSRLVLRARGSGAASPSARATRPEGSYVGELARRRRRPRARARSARRGSRSRSPAPARATSGSSRSSPTSGSTRTSCSPRAASTRPRSRTSSRVERASADRLPSLAVTHGSGAQARRSCARDRRRSRRLDGPALPQAPPRRGRAPHPSDRLRLGLPVLGHR